MQKNITAKKYMDAEVTCFAAFDLPRYIYIKKGTIKTGKIQVGLIKVRYNADNINIRNDIPEKFLPCFVAANSRIYDLMPYSRLLR